MNFDKLMSLVPKPPVWSLDWPAVRALWPDHFKALDMCPQDPSHHGEGDVGVHTKMVVTALVADPAWRALSEHDRGVLFWTAVLHDIGKPATTREEDGRITAPGHSHRGALMARAMLRACAVPFAWREAICALIVAHQVPFWLIERPDPMRMAVRLSWQCRTDLLCLHADADARGRIAADQAAIALNIELARETLREAGSFGTRYGFANDESRVAFFERDDRDPSYAAFEDPRCTVWIMSGLPGSGKDSWIAQHLSALPVVSLDTVRAEMRIAPTANQGPVLDRAREMARTHLRAGRDFVWNATNVTRQVRAKPISLARDYGARVHLVYIETPPKQLRAQNTGRQDVVPDAVMDRLTAKLQPPEPWEAHHVVLHMPDMPVA